MDDYQRWGQTWSQLGLPSPNRALFKELLTRYSEQHRAYHTIDHIHECISALDSARQIAEHPAEIEFAIWYHDAIYDTHRTDNEVQSAQLATGVLAEAGEGPAVTGRIHGLIVATQHTAGELEGDDALMVDVDLAILGADTDRFQAYERQIRTEYSWVPTDVFQAKRAAVLRGFLGRPVIYSTSAFARLEQQARSNLSESLARLGD